MLKSKLHKLIESILLKYKIDKLVRSFSSKYIYLLTIFVTFCIIYPNIFDKKVSVYGDNLNYYILGSSIANGTGYKNIQHQKSDAHIHYPPGYPAIVASIITIFSDNIIVIKAFNGFLLLSSVLLLFSIIKKITNSEPVAFISCLVTLFNYFILSYSTIMMSEISYIFFSLLALWLVLKIDLSKPIFKNYHFILLIIIATCTFYIRSIGLTLVLSTTLYFILKNKWSYSIAFVIGFITLYSPWLIRNSFLPKNSYLHQVALKNPYHPELGKVNFNDLFDRFSVNIERYISKEIPSGIVHTKEVLYNTPASFLSWIIGIVVIGVCSFALYKLRHKNIHITLYILFFSGLLLIWPHVWYGVRFLVPIIPLVIFLLVFGFIDILKIIYRTFLSSHKKNLSLLTFVLIITCWGINYSYHSVSKLKHQVKIDYPNNYKNYFSIAKWVNKNTDSNSVTCVRKKALFFLFSGKHVTNYKNTTNKEEQIEYLKSKNVDYVVVEQLGYSSTSKYLVPVIDRYPEKFKIIKELKNPNTYLMKFSPDLGYWGEWKNEKRNGYGVYNWEDGQKYIGEWKDNLRHGKGKVIFKNGELILGKWINGKLNGETIKKDSNGIIIEKSLYLNNQKIKSIKNDY
ncbi:hypothetical protein [Pseudofulvibacter geojedonensis]|uniref:Glycosyltransferase RgtA/B/C/D-like domain-containing protein n=1 Tax=Pseudofulvibacter geojedonensis TaxID=1123758 RepID=A0ABW3HZU4_9FLAO